MLGALKAEATQKVYKVNLEPVESLELHSTYILKNQKTGMYLYHSGGEVIVTNTAPTYTGKGFVIDENYLFVINSNLVPYPTPSLQNVNDVITDYSIDLSQTGESVLAKRGGSMASVTDVSEPATVQICCGGEYIMVYNGALYTVDSKENEDAQWYAYKNTPHTHFSYCSPEHWCSECKDFVGTDELLAYGTIGTSYYIVDADGHFTLHPQDDISGTVTTNASTLSAQVKALIKSACIGSNISGDMSSILSGCANLDSVDVNFASWDDGVTRTDWLKGVAAKGVLYGPKSLDNSSVYVPQSWTFKNVAEPLRFTSLDDAAYFAKGFVSGSCANVVLQYSYNGDAWHDYSYNNNLLNRYVDQFNLPKSTYLCIRAKDVNVTFSKNDYDRIEMKSSQTKVSGDITSLLNKMGTDVVPAYAFCRLFDCNEMQDASELKLPATQLGRDCYMGMFAKCIYIKKAPELPAKQLSVGCYSWMFYGCSALEEVPEISATDVLGADTCMSNMFTYCSNLRSIKVHFIDWNVTFTGDYVQDGILGSTVNWVDGVASSGTFYCPASLAKKYDTSHIPEGWTVVEGADPEPLVRTLADPVCFTANEDATIKFDFVKILYDRFSYFDYKIFERVTISSATDDDWAEIVNNASFEYSVDGNTWSDYSIGSSIEVAKGNKVYWRAKNGNSSALCTLGCTSTNYVNYKSYLHFATDKGSFVVSGDVSSLIDKYSSIYVPNYAFSYLFGEFDLDSDFQESSGSIAATAITSAKDLKLPATRLGMGCYCDMFRNCTLLEDMPELPAKSLSEECYDKMFMKCSSLKSASLSSPTFMDDESCTDMFNGCESMTSATLPAEVYACTESMNGMFNGCSSLKSVTLPAVAALDDYCCASMFEACEDLTTATVPAPKAVGDYMFYHLFENCSSLNDVTVGFTEWPSASYATNSWMYGVASTGTFHAPNCLVAKDRDESHVPVGWVGDFTNGHEFAADDETKDVCTKCGHSFLRYKTWDSTLKNPSGGMSDANGNSLIQYSNSYGDDGGVIEYNAPIVTIGGFCEGSISNTHSNRLRYITIPQTVKHVASDAFETCNNFYECQLTFPSQLEDVGHNAFYVSTLDGIEFKSYPKFDDPGEIFYCSTPKLRFNLSDDSYINEENKPSLPVWQENSKSASYTRKNVPAGYSSYCLPFKADVSDKFSKVYTPVDVALVQDDDVCILFAENTSGNVDAQTPFVGYLASACDVTINSVSNAHDIDLTSVKTTSISAFDYNGKDGALVENSDYSITWSGSYAKKSSIDGLKTMSETGDGAFADASETSPFRGFITASASANSDAKRFVGIFEGDDDIVTAVMDLRTSKVTPVEPQGIYTLDGQKVNGSVESLARGIYIVNGKKMVVK